MRTVFVGIPGSAPQRLFAACRHGNAEMRPESIFNACLLYTSRRTLRCNPRGLRPPRLDRARRSDDARRARVRARRALPCRYPCCGRAASNRRRLSQMCIRDRYTAVSQSRALFTSLLRRRAFGALISTDFVAVRTSKNKISTFRKGKSRFFHLSRLTVSVADIAVPIEVIVPVSEEKRVHVFPNGVVIIISCLLYTSRIPCR